jgi:enterochelin esterase family protein
MGLNVPAFDEPLHDRLDRLIATKAMPPVIAVFPDCSTRFGGSQYLDSAATGDYMSHLVEELVPEVDRRFRTLPARESRGVLGKSSGGFGALVAAMDHPGVFGAGASHSGDCYFEHCYGQDFPKFVREVKKRGGLEKFMKEFPSLEVKDKDELFLVNIIAMAQAYSPNGAKPPVNFDLPFDLETGELKPEIFSRWKAWDPVERCGLRVDALRSMRALYLDAGDRDEFWLDLGARILSRRFTSLEIRHHFEEFKGGHFNIQARYDKSLPFVAKALVAES